MALKIELLTFCLRCLEVSPPPAEVVAWSFRKFREPADFIFAELEAVSWLIGLSPLRGPSCQTWFTVVPLGSVSVANIVISLFAKLAERFETAKLKSPSVNVDIPYPDTGDVYTRMTELEFWYATRACAPTIPDPVGLMAQATHLEVEVPVCLYAISTLLVDWS
jgi:hypothetical protein